jgi:chloramphenicol-sensitive protein RarD
VLYRTPEHAGSTAAGVGFSLGANAIWGVMPLYFALLAHLDPVVVVAHRVAWALPLLAAYWLLARPGPLVTRRPWWVSPVLSGLILLNWLAFVWLVGVGRVTEASLAYFLAPLLMVVCGVFLLNERLTRPQVGAVTLAGLGCGVMIYDAVRIDAWSAVYVLAAVGMALAVSLYTAMRRRFDVPSVGGLLAELVPLFLPAILFLAWQGLPAETARVDVPLLVGAGVLTVVPLTLFGAAARRLEMRSIGFLHYTGPFLQLLCAFALGERFGLMRAAAFATVWCGLLIYIVSQLRRRAN